MKKILIFSSIGGGGHASTVESLRTCLDDTYEIKSVATFQDVLRPVDFINNYFGGKYSGVKLYNYFLQKNKLFLCNIFSTIGRFFLRHKNKSIIQALQAYLDTEKPDFIISVVPLVNYHILVTAQNLNIPFLIIPSDIDITQYVADFQSFIYNKIYVALPFENDIDTKRFAAIGVPENNMSVAGASIRASFLQTKNTQELKEKWHIATSDPVVLVMMGAQGSQSAVLYCQQLAKVKKGVHVLVCIGKSAQLKESIQAIVFPAHIKIQIIGFTQDIDELMAIADILVTKPGPNTICEALYSTLPILLDGTSTSLIGERYNYNFVAQHGFGEILTDIDGVAQRIDYLLSRPEIISSMKNCMINFKKKNSQHEIPALIARILK